MTEPPTLQLLPEATSAEVDATAARSPVDGPDGHRLVEVAVDAPGAGSQPFTYHLPRGLDEVEIGEAVLVDYGRRRAIGMVVGEGSDPDGRATRPVADRIRSDGPLLPPLTLALARWVADRYRAPLAITIRAFLPPGLLERLDLVAELTPDGAAAAAAGAGPGVPGGRAGDPSGPQPVSVAERAILDQLAAGRRAVPDLAGAEGRAALLRRLRALGARHLVTLDWLLAGAGGGPRYVRWLRATDAGARVAADLTAARRVPGPALGPHQRAALAELVAAGPDGASGALLADRHGASGLAGLARRGLLEVEIREAPRRPLARRPPGGRGTRPPNTELTAAQADAIRVVERAIAERDSVPIVLDGVTGAGKTAIYSAAVAASLRAGRGALVLVPEIPLATPLVDRLRADLGVEIALVHSGLGDGERADEWRRIRAGGVDVVVGTRLAIGSPLADVGLVVVDEEHDAAYKSDRTPRLQARDAAIRLAELAGAVVVLGSATPAVETIGLARSGRYRRLTLPSRPTGAPPPSIELVDLRAELADGNRGLLSRTLAGALSGLDGPAGERAILVINRRGSASIVLCRDCGHVQACPECGRPLVFHQAGYTLRCHGCGTATPLASRCPACGSARIRYLGGGTERVEHEVAKAFPHLRVGRLDRDIVERRGGAERVLDAFAAGRLDVLVGTSLVAKGIDVPEVTLVGVVSADVALNLPDERAAERTYQLLVQAVGRAGRGERSGTAIVQTYQPDHPAIRAVVDADASAFYDAELELRRRFGSPPFGRLVKLTVAMPERDDAEAAARDMAEALRSRAADRQLPVTVVGPAPAFVARRAGRWRFNVILRGDRPVDLLDGGPDAPWSIDVDPESVL